MGRHSAGQRDNEIQTGSFAKVRDAVTSHAAHRRLDDKDQQESRPVDAPDTAADAADAAATDAAPADAGDAAANNDATAAAEDNAKLSATDAGTAASAAGADTSEEAVETATQATQASATAQQAEDKQEAAEQKTTAQDAQDTATTQSFAAPTAAFEETHPATTGSVPVVVPTTPIDADISEAAAEVTQALIQKPTTKRTLTHQPAQQKTVVHSHGHSHSHSDSGATRIGAVSTWHNWRWVLMIFIILWILGTIFGLVRMWPGSSEPLVSDDFKNTFALGREQVNGTVVSITTGECSSSAAGTVFETSPRLSPEVTTSAETDDSCTWNIVQLDSGADAGQRTLIINSGMPGEPELAEGDAVVLLVSTDSEGNTTYSFGDYQRAQALIIWGVVILIAILILAGLRGVRSLIGLAFTIMVVVLFTLPALLAGYSPTAIAILTGALMLLPTVFLVHGWNWKAASSLGGTLAALAIAALLAYLAIEFANLRGLGDEENLQIIRFLPEISVTGILLCGFIIGALGVLNDVTVAQASTVNELNELDPTTPSWQLFTSAMKVGRDHITSMVYTLVLTYTGASLPILLLLSVADRPLGQTLTSDVMATEFLRTGVGALALTLAVPLTTLFAAYTVPNKKIQQEALRD